MLKLVVTQQTKYNKCISNMSPGQMAISEAGYVVLRTTKGYIYLIGGYKNNEHFGDESNIHTIKLKQWKIATGAEIQLML